MTQRSAYRVRPHPIEPTVDVAMPDAPFAGVLVKDMPFKYLALEVGRGPRDLQRAIVRELTWRRSHGWMNRGDTE